MTLQLPTHPGSEQSAGPFHVAFNSSPGFAAWLEGTGGSLALSAYQAGRVFLVAAASGKVHVQQRRTGPAMGLAADAGRIWIASRDQLWRFANTGPRLIAGTEHDVVYAPRWGIVTGPCDTHEIVANVAHAGRDHEIVFVNTRFSCLATIDAHYSFMPLWKPRFISGLSPDDRCHLNGVAVRGGRVAYVTACAESDESFGWRAAKAGGGIVIDVAADAVIARGLSMPHSPRWHEGRIWLCNSGTAEFGWIDPDEGIFNPLVACPGFARGTALIGGRWAVIGLSRQREGAAQLPMADSLAQQGVEARCGIIVVDLRSGRIEHELTVDGSLTELFDVAFIGGARRPYSTGFSEPELQRELFNLPPLADFPISRLGPAPTV